MIVIYQFRPNFFYRLFKHSAAQTYLVLGLHYLISKTTNGTEQVAYEYLENISSEKFLLWKKLRLKTSTGSKINFGWVSGNTSDAIINALQNQGYSTEIVEPYDEPIRDFLRHGEFNS